MTKVPKYYLPLAAGLLVTGCFVASALPAQRPSSKYYVLLSYENRKTLTPRSYAQYDEARLFEDLLRREAEPQNHGKRSEFESLNLLYAAWMQGSIWTMTRDTHDQRLKVAVVIEDGLREQIRDLNGHPAFCSMNGDWPWRVEESLRERRSLLQKQERWMKMLVHRQQYGCYKNSDPLERAAWLALEEPAKELYMQSVSLSKQLEQWSEEVVDQDQDEEPVVAWLEAMVMQQKPTEIPCAAHYIGYVSDMHEKGIKGRHLALGEPLGGHPFWHRIAQERVWLAALASGHPPLPSWFDQGNDRERERAWRDAHPELFTSERLNPATRLQEPEAQQPPQHAPAPHRRNSKPCNLQ